MDLPHALRSLALSIPQSGAHARGLLHQRPLRALNRLLSMPGEHARLCLGPSCTLAASLVRSCPNVVFQMRLSERPTGSLWALLVSPRRSRRPRLFWRHLQTILRMSGAALLRMTSASAPPVEFSLMRHPTRALPTSRHEFYSAPVSDSP